MRKVSMQNNQHSQVLSTLSVPNHFNDVIWTCSLMENQTSYGSIFREMGEGGASLEKSRILPPNPAVCNEMTWTSCPSIVCTDEEWFKGKKAKWQKIVKWVTKFYPSISHYSARLLHCSTVRHRCRCQRRKHPSLRSHYKQRRRGLW